MSFITFFSLAPSALISWPGRGTPRNPPSSFVTSISVASLTSRHTLCRIQQVIIVEGTLSTDSSSLFRRHRHLPFNSPNACSTTTLAPLSDLLKSLWLSVKALIWGKGFIHKGSSVCKLDQQRQVVLPAYNPSDALENAKYRRFLLLWKASSLIVVISIASFEGKSSFLLGLSEEPEV